VTGNAEKAWALRRLQPLLQLRYPARKTVIPQAAAPSVMPRRRRPSCETSQVELP
jgi:hypothetical protein